MADFCKQCGDRYDLGNDMKGRTSTKAWAKGLATPVICEGCGYIQVDPEGNCTGECLEGHAGTLPVTYDEMAPE